MRSRTRRLHVPKPQLDTNITRLAKAYREFFAKEAASVAAQLAPKVKAQVFDGLHRVHQEHGDPLAVLLVKADPPSDEEVERILAAIRLGDWDVLINPTEEEVSAVTAAGIKAALKILQFEGGETTVNEARERLGLSPKDGGDVAPAIVNQVNERSVKYAKERAADLVTQIEENTRDMLRATVASAVEEGWGAAKLADEIKDSPAFSDERAMMIARTELIAANNAGNMEAYRDSGVAPFKEWVTAQDDLVSEGCQENEDAGPIPIDEAFPSGDDYPPAHPNCRCAVVPAFSEEGGDAEGEATEEAAHSEPIQRVLIPVVIDPKMPPGEAEIRGASTVRIVNLETKTAFERWLDRVTRLGKGLIATGDEMTDPVPVKMPYLPDVDRARVDHDVWEVVGQILADIRAGRMPASPDRMQAVPLSACWATQEEVSAQRVKEHIEETERDGAIHDPPILYDMGDGQYAVLDGHHRIQAAIELGITMAECDVLRGKPDLASMAQMLAGRAAAIRG